MAKKTKNEEVEVPVVETPVVETPKPKRVEKKNKVLNDGWELKHSIRHTCLMIGDP